MHELGILRHIVKTVSRIAEEKGIGAVRHITLEVGARSTFVPEYLTKLFPVAADGIPLLQGTQLRIDTVDGSGLIIRDIGYELTERTNI